MTIMLSVNQSLFVTRVNWTPHKYNYSTDSIGFRKIFSGQSNLSVENDSMHVWIQFVGH